MSAQPLLDRLQRVSKHSDDRWRAICPAHESRHRTQSLSIRELPDGTVLLKCFAGCSACDVVTAVGLQFKDLFPQNLKPGSRGVSRPGHWHAMREALQTLKFESTLVAIVAGDMCAGRELSNEDVVRLLTAAERIRAAVEACR